jgi:hypothetical protein
MAWGIDVRRPDNFFGTAWHTQLIKRDGSYKVTIFGTQTISTGGTNKLDTEVKYGESHNLVQLFGPPNAQTRTVLFPDAPDLIPDHLAIVDFAEMKDDFHTYLRFQAENSNSIPVTLGRVDWGWHGRGVFTNGAWSLVISTNYGPNFDFNDHSDPYWQQVYP